LCVCVCVCVMTQRPFIHTPVATAGRFSHLHRLKLNPTVLTLTLTDKPIARLPSFPTDQWESSLYVGKLSSWFPDERVERGWREGGERVEKGWREGGERVERGWSCCLINTTQTAPLRCWIHVCIVLYSLYFFFDSLYIHKKGPFVSIK